MRSHKSTIILQTQIYYVLGVESPWPTYPEDARSKRPKHKGKESNSHCPYCFLLSKQSGAIFVDCWRHTKTGHNSIEYVYTAAR